MTDDEADSGRRPDCEESDHPIRRTALWVAFDRLWRPATGWAVCAGVVYTGIIGPAQGHQMDPVALSIWLGFGGLVWGAKTVEKIRGVA